MPINPQGTIVNGIRIPFYYEGKPEEITYPVSTRVYGAYADVPFTGSIEEAGYREGSYTLWDYKVKLDVPISLVGDGGKTRDYLYITKNTQQQPVNYRGPYWIEAL